MAPGRLIEMLDMAATFEQAAGGTVKVYHGLHGKADTIAAHLLIVERRAVAASTPNGSTGRRPTRTGSDLASAQSGLDGPTSDQPSHPRPSHQASSSGR